MKAESFQAETGYFLYSRIVCFVYYRPQTKFAKVMYLHLPGGGTPGTPAGQVHPLGRYTPSGRYTPIGRYTPQVGTSPLGRYIPLAGTPNWEGTHTPRQVHSPGRYTPNRYTPSEQCMLGDTGNKQAVRILLKCILVCSYKNK